jgi:hypothetical protein
LILLRCLLDFDDEFLLIPLQTRLLALVVVVVVVTVVMLAIKTIIAILILVRV